MQRRPPSYTEAMIDDPMQGATPATSVNILSATGRR